MSWVITPSNTLVDDQDALAYLAAVEAADGQALESATRLAVNAFVKGCKADGIWPAIKASCILAGARTLAGALVPLAGTAPTNVSFVSGDYNRKTGLVGDGSTKYLNSNRSNNADPQNSQHLFARVTTVGTNLTAYLGAGGAEAGASLLGIGTAALSTRSRNSAGIAGLALTATTNVGLSRALVSGYSTRCAGTTSSVSQASDAPLAGNIHVFQRNAASPLTTNARIAFYSIGESLDLALIDARVTDLINAIGAAIP